MICLYGAGGHAKVVMDIFHATNKPVQWIFDDNAAAAEMHGFKPKKFDALQINEDWEFFISVGDNKQRKLLSERINTIFAKAIYPNAVISPSAFVGEGSAIMQNSVVQANTGIGKHCIINTAAVVEHDCTIGNFAHIGPNATVCGGCNIGEGALVGASAVVLPNIAVGNWSIIGSGAVVTKNIEDYAVYAGNPAKKIRNVPH